MRKAAALCAFVATLGLIGPGAALQAQEHPGEHPGVQPKHGEKVTPDMIRSGIKSFIDEDTALKGGYFLIYDDQLKKTWTLEFVKIHDRVSVIKGKTYFACCDFRTPGGGKDATTLDIDIWMEKDRDAFKAVDVKIHKLDGKPRYTYDKDEIVPLD